MIPQHLIYRAAQAMWEVGTSSEWRDDVWAAPHLTRARAALEAVAADIFQHGYNLGRTDELLNQAGIDAPDNPNPYRASEEA